MEIRLVRPIRYDISIIKQGDNFLLKYKEFFDKNDAKHIEAMENTIKHIDIIKINSPKRSSISSMTINQEEYSVTMEKEMTFEDIADQIVSEFMTFSRMGKLSLQNLFEIIVRNSTGIKRK